MYGDRTSEKCVQSSIIGKQTEQKSDNFLNVQDRQQISDLNKKTSETTILSVFDSDKTYSCFGKGLEVTCQERDLSHIIEARLKSKKSSERPKLLKVSKSIRLNIPSQMK
jgi:hypothetical protein